MQNKKIQASIIMVYYKAQKELFYCIKSIIESKPKVSYEIIVVDNDEKKTIEKKLIARFPHVKYIKSPANIGFGAGNNLGANQAKGEYLFFLNPDTEIFKFAIEGLVKFLKRYKDVAIVAPLLLGRDDKPYDQGSKRLTPLNAIFALSFLNKIFPYNPIARNYKLLDWNKKDIKEVDVVPGTAFMIRRSIFNQIEGFDENYFLYFEEFDLCNRVKKLGYKIFILPEAKVKHLWEISTKRASFNIKEVFQKSRFYYFKKYYGTALAFFVEIFLRLNKTHVLLTLILALGAYLRVYKISELMPFIGDQGWFYLSARDIVLTGNIPLVGIASSHPWLHQGPLWTYFLALIFKIFGFNPIIPAYFTAVLGILTVWLVYKVGSELFRKETGLIASLLYSSSPLVIIHSRTPYHTSPIPLFTLLFFYTLYKWVKGNIYFFPLSIFLLAILYNLELATSILWFIFLLILIFGAWRKKEWFLKVLCKKIAFFSLIAFVFPMLPILIYDINNGFPQTIKFVVWIGYRILRFFGFPSIYTSDLSPSISDVILFLYSYNQRLIFLPSGIIALIIFILSFGFFSLRLYQLYKRNTNYLGALFLFLFLVVSFGAYLVNKTPSEAYLPIFFPIIIMIAALFFNKVMQIKYLFALGILSIISITLINSYFLMTKRYPADDNFSFSKRLLIAEKIIKESGDREYDLVGVGKGSEFESFTMNYEYLAWWLGHGPTKEPQSLRFVVRETSSGIKAEKKIINREYQPL